MRRWPVQSPFDALSCAQESIPPGDRPLFMIHSVEWVDGGRRHQPLHGRRTSQTGHSGGLTFPCGGDYDYPAVRNVSGQPVQSLFVSLPLGRTRNCGFMLDSS